MKFCEKQEQKKRQKKNRSFGDRFEMKVRIIKLLFPALKRPVTVRFYLIFLLNY